MGEPQKETGAEEMKEGFSRLIENICSRRQDMFDLIPLYVFDDLTVEPVPGICDIPNPSIEYQNATATHLNYHKARKEREGRG